MKESALGGNMRLTPLHSSQVLLVEFGVMIVIAGRKGPTGFMDGCNPQQLVV